MTQSTAPELTAPDPVGWTRAVRTALVAFVLSRVFVLAGASIVAAQQVVEINDAKGQRPANAARLLRDVLISWDGKWYLRIVADGYPRLVPSGITYDDLPARTAFFPAFPRLVGVVDVVLPGGPIVAGLLLNLVLGVAAMLLVGRLAMDLWGTRVAERSMILMALFPGSFVLSFMYSEALLLALAAGCLLALHRRQWWPAGVLAAAGTATRPNGLALVAACAVASLLAIRERREWGSLVAPLLAPIGFVGFQLFLWRHTGELGVWFRVQREAWDEGASFGLSALDGMLDFVRHPLSSPTDALTALSLVTTAILVVAMWKRRPSWPVAAFTAVVLLLMLLPATVTARPRFLYTAFPLLVSFARWRDDDSPDVWAAVYCLCSAGLVTLTAMYGVRGAIP
jgi:hypothetical protein